MAQLKAIESTAVRGRVSEAEWQTRVDLAACYRLMALYGMTDLSTTTSRRAYRELPTSC